MKKTLDCKAIITKDLGLNSWKEVTLHGDYIVRSVEHWADSLKKSGATVKNDQRPEAFRQWIQRISSSESKIFLISLMI